MRRGSRSALPFLLAVTLLGLGAGVYMSYAAVEEAQLRETVLRGLYEGTQSESKGFEAYLLADAVEEKSPGARLKEPPGQALVAILSGTARGRLPEGLPPLDPVPVRHDGTQRHPFLFGEKKLVVGEVACRVAVFVPAYLTPGAGEALSAELAEELRRAAALDDVLCRALDEHAPRMREAGALQAYYVSPRGWVRLLRRESDQAGRDDRLKMDAEFAATPNISLADRPMFRRCWAKPGEVLPSAPYIDATFFGLVLTAAVVRVSDSAAGLPGMVAIDIQIGSTEDYLATVSFNAGPSFLASVERAEVNCETHPGAGAARLVCDVHAAHPAALVGIARLAQGEPVLDGRSLRTYDLDAETLVFVVPVGLARYTYFVVEARRLAVTSTVMWLLVALVALVVLGLASTLLYFRQKRTEEEAVLREVQQNMPGGLAIADEGGRILFANAFLQRQVGQEDLIQRRLDGDIFDQEGGKRYAALCRTREPFDLLVTLRSGDGAAVTAIANVAAIDYRGQPARMTVLLPLDRMGPVIASRFVNDFAHALKTPAHALVVASEAIAKPDLSTARRRRYADLIAGEANRFREMVDNFLGFAALDLGIVDRNPPRVDLTRHLRDFLCAFETRAKDAGLDFRFTAPKRLRFSVDEPALRQVLTNLLENALKYTDRGRITVSVRRATMADGFRAAEIEVEDTGIGIPPEELETIFERFQRGHSARVRAQEGLGLGLYLVKRHLQILGGTISVESQPGRGTTFRVRLPESALPGPPDGVDGEDDEHPSVAG